MHLFHKWGKWESYIERGTIVFNGILIPPSQRGKTYPYSDLRQRRSCEICGKTQDEIIRERS